MDCSHVTRANMHVNASVRGSCMSDWLYEAQLHGGRSFERRLNKRRGAVAFAVGSVAGCARHTVGLTLFSAYNSRGPSPALQTDFRGERNINRRGECGGALWGWGVVGRHRKRAQQPLTMLRAGTLTVESASGGSSADSSMPRKRKLGKTVSVKGITLINTKNLKNSTLPQHAANRKGGYFKQADNDSNTTIDEGSSSSTAGTATALATSFSAAKDVQKRWRQSKEKEKAEPDAKGLRKGGHFKQVDSADISSTTEVSSPKPKVEQATRGGRKRRTRRGSTATKTTSSSKTSSSSPTASPSFATNPPLGTGASAATGKGNIPGLRTKKSWNEVVEMSQERAKRKADDKRKVEAKLDARKLAEEKIEADAKNDAENDARIGAEALAEAEALADFENREEARIEEEIERREENIEIKKEVKDSAEGSSDKAEDAEEKEEYDFKAVKRQTRKAQKWATSLDFKLMGHEHESIPDDMWKEMAEELGLLPRWRPMTSFLVENLGFTSKDLTKIMGRREEIFSCSVDRAHSRCAFLREIGLKKEDVRKVVLSHPRVLEYRVERTMQNRIHFLKEVGVAEADIPKVVVRAPVIFACHVERTLKPRVNYLINEVGVPATSIGAVIARHPLILSHSVEEMMAPRVHFLRDLGVSKEGVAKMVMKHPQILQYKVESMLPRLQYLQSIGMSEDDIILCVSRLSQVFSLSVDTSLRPKFEYLKKELGGSVTTVTSYPAYFSLSLENRIKPRHRLLVKLKKTPSGPFPMKYLSLTDQDFADKVARVPLADYEAFRERSLQNAAIAKSNR
mmetsp:Transcript_33415/g.56105  ORF Transcript_33415/g.56105 Transcript_33415/m.56105 type:complete len:796 (+) Transcript_33415:176-2563(+)|eukprot:CAMPEP_0198205740 /NCGR_PEP_ID=MMETSP1445-20131203/9268_1 /TAXON_ID=36898 /ORGANISM="Pyramimonas sp., Strain CCMP2087" /LENGTH=795 /DNA_ID=CAMNT_0043878147 /DNA_START=152 /DNA_END=2539 /DNA_ORIENTATION=+